MIGWLAAAAAHPFGAHDALHHVAWDLGPDTMVVRYTVDVPSAYLRRDRPDPLADMQAELTAGLQLQVDGRTTPLTPVFATHGPPEHVTRFVLQASAPMPAGPATLTLVDGNLLHTPPRIQVDLAIDPALEVTASSLWVPHDRRIVRSESGRLRKGDAHRTTTLTVAPRALPDRLHRRLQGYGDRPTSDFGARSLAPADVLYGNRTTPTLAGALLLGLPALGARSGPPGRVIFALVPLAFADLALPADALGVPWALGAALCAGLTLRWPTARWLVGPLLAASLDLRGAAALVAGLQILAFARWREPLPQPAARRIAGLALILALAQAARAY